MFCIPFLEKAKLSRNVNTITANKIKRNIKSLSQNVTFGMEIFLYTKVVESDVVYGVVGEKRLRLEKENSVKVI